MRYNPPVQEEKRLHDLVSRSVFQAGMRPIKDGRTIAIELPSGTVSLVKADGAPSIESMAPSKPDLTFVIPELALQHLESVKSDSIGDVGIEIAKLLLDSDPKRRMQTKVHIGVFDMVRFGYLGVLPLGGPAFMKFLTTQGFGSMSKIRSVLSKLRG